MVKGYATTPQEKDMYPKVWFLECGFLMESVFLQKAWPLTLSVPIASCTKFNKYLWSAYHVPAVFLGHEQK